jgi:hypothetical protein
MGDDGPYEEADTTRADEDLVGVRGATASAAGHTKAAAARLLLRGANGRGDAHGLVLAEPTDRAASCAAASTADAVAVVS